jgi:trimeric autotransporter adhesin
MFRSIVLLAVVSASAYEGGLPKATPKGISGSAWSSIRAEHERHRQAVLPADGGHRARNYGQQWVTRFDGRGFDVTPDASGWRWGLQLQSYGFPGQEHGVQRARAYADVERFSYQWDPLMTEWFVNASRGLEHGFTLASRPGQSAAALTLHLAVRGTLTPRVSGDGRWVSFLDNHGAPALNYAGLKVTDARGRELAARFAREPDGLRLDVEERSATYPITIDPTAQQAYLKPATAGTTQAGDWFGYSVAVSGDTVVVGAPQEDSSSLGINSTPNELAAGSAGAAYVFTQSGGVWSQQAYLKPASAGPGGQAGDHFGFSVAISGDIVVVGAPMEDSSSVGVNSTPLEGATDSGAAYVFIRGGGVWTQQAYLKPPVVGISKAAAGFEFGWSVAISGDTVAVGAYNEPSSSTGVNSSPNEGASGAGAAYVFARSGGAWSQQAYLKPGAVGTSQANDHFGAAIAVSGDTVVVGAFQEDSSSTGVNSTPNELSGGAGAAYVYVRSFGAWSQQAYLKPAVVGNQGQAGHFFGTSVAVSGDIVAVGANHESSSTLGINTTPNESAGSSGAVYVFVRNTGVWSQQAYVKPSAVGTTQAGDNFGISVALSGDTMVVGADGEGSSTTGINTTPNESAAIAGAAYAFTRSGGVWSQQAYLKPAAVGTTQAGDRFGWSVAVSGETAVVGAYLEDSSSLGVNSTPNEAAADSGAAYVFTVPGSVTAGGSKAEMISPASGATLSGSSVTFTWSAGSGAVAYWLDVGSAQGQGNIFGQNVGLATSQTVNGIPTDGSTVYVKLWTLLGGAWQSNDYTYTAGGVNNKAVMTSPASGSTLSGAIVTFTWSAASGAAAYWLDVGSASGQGNIFGQNVGLATSQTVNGLPTDGSTVYVKLWTLLGGTWQSSDYTYKGGGANTKAVMLIPSSATTLSGASVTFTWSAGSGAVAYWLDIGSAQGQGNIYGQNVALATSQTVNGIPTDGSTVYVRLWTLLGGTWQFNDYTYKAGGANTKAVMLIPAPATALGGGSATFTWSAATGAAAYWLDVGSAQGQGNIFGQNVALATSQTVTGIPADGSTVYVRLWTLSGSTWQSNDYTYKASGGTKAVMTAPALSSVLSGSNVTFTWSAAGGATSYWLDVGTVAGGFNLYTQGEGLSTSQAVTGLPTGGGTIYVRLWSAINGIWQYSDSTYKAAP